MKNNKIKILIADDDHELVEVLSNYIEMSGFETLSAYEGVRALEVVHKSNPDLVILDLNMPAGNGMYVLKTLRSQWQTKKIPVIILTGLNDPNLKKQIEELGGQDFITKPYDSAELLRKIQKLVNPHEEKEEDTLRLLGESMTQEKQNSKKNILIVEDEVFLAETIGARLEFLGYAVSYAENGQVALDKCGPENLKKSPVDLILMDALMPIMDGFEATRLIKAKHPIPIVFLTAMARTEDQEKAFSLGADDYLAKPFEMSELITIIKKWLER